MLITCDNKGCLKASSALLDVKSGEVVCQECNKLITNVSGFMKKALKDAGQIVRNAEKKAFMVHCRQCNANREIILNQTDVAICKDCHSAVVVHAAFKQALKEANKKLKESEESEEDAQNPPEK